jgi:putative ABC transport system permease protein
MRLSGIRYIYEARLSARAVLVQEGFAILGIAVGVALLFASQVASTSLSQSVARLTNQFVGSAQVALDARGPEGFNERLLDEVRGVSGVQVAMPVFERQVNLVGPSGERSVDLIGVEPGSVGASGRLLRRFSARQLARQEAIALPAPLAREIGGGPLMSVKLQIGVRLVETLVAATLEESAIGGLVHDPVAVASLGYAQRIADARDQLTWIYVRYHPARAGSVRAALARLAARSNVNLVPGSYDAQLFGVAVAPESKSEALFAGISALVGFMFALNAMLITVPSRRRLIEDLRPHGATRWMTVQILLLDAAVLGVLACGLGLILGDVVSITLFHSTPSYLAFAFPIGNSRIVTWQSAAIAAVAGLIAATVGVLWPLRQLIAGQPPRSHSISSVRGGTLAAARLTLGLLCLAVTTVILLVDEQSAVLGNITLVVALVCLLPFILDGLIFVFASFSNALDGVPSALAITELQMPQTRVRSLAIAATAAVAVFGIVEFQGTQTNLEKGLESSLRDTDSSSSIWVIPSGRSSLQPTTPFKAIDTAALSRVPGVGRLGVYRGSFLNWGARRLWVIAPASDADHPVPPSQLVAGNLALATERVTRARWAVLSQALAAEHHLRVGQEFLLPSPRPLTLRVAGLTTNLGWPPGSIILSASNYARAWGSADPSAYQIQTALGASTATVSNLLRRALPLETRLAVETSTERERRHYAVAAQGLAGLAQIRLLVLIAATLAVVGAMGSMLWQRRDRIAFMKCHGFREAVLWRALLSESAILLTAGASIGAVFGLCAQLLASHALATVTGFPIAFDEEGTAAASSFVLLLGITVAVLAIPGYLVVRVPPRTVSPAY